MALASRWTCTRWSLCSMRIWRRRPDSLAHVTTGPWCFGALVLWCFGALVLWCFGALVLWCFGALGITQQIGSKIDLTAAVTEPVHALPPVAKDWQGLIHELPGKRQAGAGSP